MRPFALALLLTLGLTALLPAQSNDRLPIQAPYQDVGPRVVAPRPVSAAPYDWPQLNFDARHTGNNVRETIVSRENVSSLKKLFTVSLPEIADGAPAVASGIATPSGVRDLLFVTTKAGRIVALDARTGATLWSRQPASGPNYTTSSPALDPNRQFVYSYGLDGFVHKYALSDGAEVMGGGWPELATLKPSVEKGSSALAIARAADGVAYLYVANSGYPTDAGDYQGHLTTIRLADGAQNIFNANCSDKKIHFVENGDADSDCASPRSAMWARVGAVYDDRTGRIYVATGNGRFSGTPTGPDWGDSVLALHPDGTGTGAGPVDSYTPVDFQMLEDEDADLGSTAPALLPETGSRRFRVLGVQGGKDWRLRLLNMEDLSGQAGPGHVGGELQLIYVPQGGGVLTAPAVWSDPDDSSAWVIVVTGFGISGLQLVFDPSGNPSLVTRWMSGLGGFSPIVANGVVYFAADHRIAALDPRTGTVLWSDGGIGSIHWESPILVNGILYITDEDGALSAYSPSGLLPSAAANRKP